MAFTYNDLWTLRMDEAIKRRVIAGAAQNTRNGS